MNEQIPRLPSKRCVTRDCTFNNLFPNGIPENFITCSICGVKLEYDQEEINVAPTVPEKVAEPIHLPRNTSPISGQPSELKVIFRTIMIKQHFVSNGGILTIRFYGDIFGNSKEDSACLKQTEEVKYKEIQFVILEGFVTIPNEIFHISNYKAGFGLAYKYFLNNKVESSKHFRTIYLKTPRIKNIIYKYDYMVISCENLIDRHTFLTENIFQWRFSFNIFANIANIANNETIFTFEEQVSTFKNIANDIFRLHIIPHKTKIEIGIVDINDCKTIGSLLDYDREGRAKWLAKQISAANSSRALLKVFIFILLFVRKKELDTNYEKVLTLLLNSISLDHIEELVSKQSFFSDHFNNYALSMQHLQASFENIIFQTPRICDNKVVVKFLPLYHSLFKLTAHFERLHRNQGLQTILTNEYWGFPPNIEINPFYPFQDLKYSGILLDKFNQCDPILIYSVLLISMDENNFQHLSTNYIIPIASYLFVFIYRMENWPLEFSPITLQSQIFSFLFSKLNRKPDLITETQLHQVCNSVFYIWEFNLGNAKPQDTNDGFLHLNLTTTILSMLSDFDPSMLSRESIQKRPFEYFKSSEELLEIFLQTFETLIIKQTYEMNRVVKKIKLWPALFSYEFPDSYNWNSIVESRFISMIQELDMSITVGVFIDLSTDHMIPAIIYFIFKQRIVVFLETKTDQDSQECILRHLVKLPITVHSQLIDILNIFYHQQRQAFEDNPAIHILSWSPWYILFDFNLPETQEKNQEIAQLVKNAYYEFINLCKCLREMKIQVYILRILQKFKMRFLSTYYILSQKYPEELLLGSFDIKNMIEESLTILAYFDEQSKLISKFNSILSFASHLLESQEIKDFLKFDFEAQPLNEICCRNSSGDFRILPNSCLDSNLNTLQVQRMLMTSSDLKSSHIFLNAFKELVSSKFDFNQAQIIEMKNIYYEIWNPTLLKCVDLVSNILNREISLILVEKHFGIFREAEERIRSEITYLTSAIAQITGCKQSSPDTINISARVLIQYFKFKETCELASLINLVHIEFCRDGDFEQINTLVNLNNSEFTRNNTLKIITNELENLTTQLSQYDTFSKSLISSYVSHPEFIKWARDTLVDRQQMKVFIDLALTSCGESDFNINRITCFRSVCFSLAPLIFDIHPQCDYKQFLDLFNSAIEQIVERERFLNTFDEAANLLHVWKHMALAHSSVGKSTVQELAEILESGYIDIQFDTVNDNSDILLHIPDPVNRIYTLEGLKDLKSKIALIKAETKTTQQIDLFSSIFENTMATYVLVEKLINLGHTSYMNYSQKFECNLQALSILNKEIELGNEELKNWKNTLDNARREFYSLNFYTNLQILLLRRDLKLFQSTNILNPQIFHLISLLNPNFNLEVISNGISNVSYPLQEISNKSELISVLTESVDNQPVDRFPSNFSEDDRKLCISFSEERGIDINLSIIGIKQFKRDLNEFNDVDLEAFCLDNADLIHSACEELDNDKVELSTELTIPFDSSANFIDDNHLSLEALSIFLEEIRMNCPKIHRHLPNTCKSGHPNLLFVPNGSVFYFILSQYILCDDVESLPSSQEIIICEEETMLEEIDIFFRRAIWDTNSNYLFSLLFVERLKYEVAVQSIELLKKYMSSSNNPKYNLLLICSTEYENRSYFASAIYKYKRISPTFLENDILKDTLFKQFTLQDGCILSNESQLLSACFIDKDKSKISIFASNSVGAGKSLAISSLVTELQQLNNLNRDSNSSYTIPLYGGKQMESETVEKLISSEIGERTTPHLFHFDVASTVMDEIIPFLFKLLILGGLKDKRSNVWSCKSTDYYTVEITLTEENGTLARFCDLFPITLCLQPKPALEKMRENKLCNEIALNDNQFKSPLFQRSYVYLHKKEMKQKFEDFSYVTTSEVYGNPVQFMEIILKNCGLENPSWSELSYFIHFIGHQFYSCEQNIYYQTALLEDDWKGFRTFLINMIIPMSRDIATPSLSITFDNSGKDLLSGYSIESRRRWEHKNLPYLYLNGDRQSMTFFGINISKSLTLLDPSDPTKVLVKKFISKSLYSVLTRNLVNFQDDCYKWDKAKKISVLANVIGIDRSSELISQQDSVQDPDPTYVLTVDNLKKILAIHMRFRCNIPVIIMGETGCGKTRLIYYMCQLQSQFAERVNMRVLKIHGGTTRADIISELHESIKLAEENVSYNIDTVLFFDEANTSHSIGLIKEILCDRRINGSPIPNNIRLQFVAACNPYRKHSEAMLIKLMSAGLGKVTIHEEVTEKFGKIPLRELVYRVVELPKSLLPLVWDFGQLSKEVEESYIKEIIKRHLEKSPIKLVPSLLNGSLKYSL